MMRLLPVHMGKRKSGGTDKNTSESGFDSRNKRCGGKSCKVADKLWNGKGDFFVGERLSYPDEAIVQGSADSFCDYEGDALSVIYIENKEAEGLPSTHGVKDSAFLRDKVPMTKEEVRCVSLAKLGLREDSVCYDVERVQVLCLSKWHFARQKAGFMQLKRKKRQWSC